jgi:integrase
VPQIGHTRAWENTPMGRPSKPWYDSTHNRWRVYLNGKRHTLASGAGPAAERAAWEEFARLRSGQPKPSAETPKVNPAKVPKVRELVASYLEISDGTIGRDTLNTYRNNLSEFVDRFGEMPSTSIKNYHVTEWIAAKNTWGNTMRRNVVGAIKRCWFWAAREDRIPFNPLATLKRPPAANKISIPNRDDVAALLGEADKADLGPVLRFAHATGCRIGEAMKLTAADLREDCTVATVHNKTGRKTGKPRVIYIPSAIRDMVREAAEQYKSGPIFRSSVGAPWNTTSVTRRVRKIREKLGLGPEAVPKMMRHDWITEALSKGVSIKIVAELAGHTSSAMIDKVYSHLGDRSDVLLKAAESVRADNSECEDVGESERENGDT